MSNTPRWLNELIWDTAAWQSDCFAMLYRTLLFIDTQSFGLLPVAMVSGAEHELDYYYQKPTPRAEIQTCIEGWSAGKHRWRCYECDGRGPENVDGAICKAELAHHLKTEHGITK